MTSSIRTDGNAVAPWPVRYDEHYGYDCMTSGVKVGPVYLDGANYGQKRCEPISRDSLKRMMADARRIAEVPTMYAGIVEFCRRVDAGEIRSKRTYEAFAAIIERVQATGERHD